MAQQRVRVKSIEEIEKLKDGRGNIDDVYFSDKMEKYCKREFMMNHNESELRLIDTDDSSRMWHFSIDMLDIIPDQQYMVQVEGKKLPKVSHYFMNDAEKEAQRLANKENNKTQVVTVHGTFEPRKWYENIPDGGVLCYVRDLEHSVPSIEVVTSYDPTSMYKFKGRLIWIYAEPVPKTKLEQLTKNLLSITKR